MIAADHILRLMLSTARVSLPLCHADTTRLASPRLVGCSGHADKPPINNGYRSLLRAKRLLISTCTWSASARPECFVALFTGVLWRYMPCLTGWLSRLQFFDEYITPFIPPAPWFFFFVVVLVWIIPLLSLDSLCCVCFLLWFVLLLLLLLVLIMKRMC